MFWRILIVFAAVLCAFLLAAGTLSAASASANHATPLSLAKNETAGNALEAFLPPGLEPIGSFELGMESGTPAPGSNVEYKLSIAIYGTAPVPGVVLQMNFAKGYTYLSDTSGYTPVLHERTLTWRLDEDKVGPELGFSVFFSVGAKVELGRSMDSTLNIHSSDDSQYTPVTISHHTEVTAGEIDIYTNPMVGWDPAPGVNFEFILSVCNGGSVSSNIVTFTGTASTYSTIISIRDQDRSWNTLSLTPERIVLQRPAINNNSCSTLWLGVHIAEDAPIGVTSTIHTVAGAVHDTDLSNNEGDLNNHVSAPYLSAELKKYLTDSNAPLVAGSELSFELNFHLKGNTTVPTLLLTETVPAYTNFLQSWVEDEAGNKIPFPPDQQGQDWVAWNIAQTWHDFSEDIHVALKVAENVPPGSVLTNTATLDLLVPWAYQRVVTAEWHGQFWGHGPNLSFAEEQSDWWPEPADKMQVRHLTRVKNLGDETTGPVTITIQYPAELTIYTDTVWVWADEEVTLIRHQPDLHTFQATIKQLNPGEQAGVYYWGKLDRDDYPAGVVFTHYVSLPVPPGEANPNDNQSQSFIFTGPDLNIVQYQYYPPPKPGEEFILQVVLVNEQYNYAQSGDSGQIWVTDTLPLGVELVKSSVPPAKIDGRKVSYQWDNFPSFSSNNIYLTLRFLGDINSRNDFKNIVDIVGTAPEVPLNNNHSELSLQADWPPPRLYLPFLQP